MITPYKINTHLFGIKIEITCDDKKLYSALLGFISQPCGPCDSRQRITIKLSIIKDRHWRVPAFGNKQIPVFYAPYIKCFWDKQKRHYFYTDLKEYLAILKSKSRVDGLIAEELLTKPNFIRHAIIIPLISEVFKLNELYKLHAAALENEKRGLLFVGPSGSAKTTLSLILVKKGYQFISDDLVFIKYPGHTIEAASIINTDFKVKTKANNCEVVKMLNPSIVWPKAKISRTTIQSVIFPKITNQAKTKIIHINYTEAFGLLLKSNSLIAYGPQGIIRKHISCFKKIASLKERYIILLGKDALIKPEVIPGILDSLRK